MKKSKEVIKKEITELMYTLEEFDCGDLLCDECPLESICNEFCKLTMKLRGVI